MANKITFQYADRKLQVKNKTGIKSFAETLFSKEKASLKRVSYIFCSDDYLLDINKRFLKHDFYTDIITFGLSEKGEPVLAEIYISLDRVKDNAINMKKDFAEEVLRVIFHGVLHLCGYGDKTESEIKTMRAKEDFYIKQFHKVPRITVSSRNIWK